MSSVPATPKMEFSDNESSPVKRPADEEHPDMSPAKKVPHTPRKKSAAKEPKAKTPKTPRTPKTPGTTRTSGNAIPATREEASQEDQMIVKMKEEGKKAKEIKAAYEEMTGKKVGNSTLSVRISRLLATWARLNDGDDEKLLEALEKFEEERAAFDKTKFQRIAAIMESMGAPKYSTILLEKELKKIQAAQAAGTWVPTRPKGPEDDDDDDDDDMADEAAKADGDDDEEEEDDGDDEAMG